MTSLSGFDSLDTGWAGWIRRLAKRTAEVTLTRAGAATLGHRLHRDRPVILGYHNVIPDNAEPRGERSLHLSRSEFGRQLDTLAEIRQVVPLDELWDEDDLDAGRGRAAVTFDDAYQGALTLGVEEVVKRGMPATIFACPGLLGGRAFWWDQLAGGFDGVLPSDVRDTSLWHLAGRQDAILAWAEERGLSPARVDRHARSGEEADLRHAASLDGIRVAPHTWSHPNLAALDEEAVVSELRQAAAWLDERFDDWLPWVSYPYGLESAQTRRIARGIYDAGLRIRGGFAPRDARDREAEEWFRLPRFNIPSGATLENFVLRLAGIVPS